MFNLLENAVRPGRLMTHHTKIPEEFGLRDDRLAWLAVIGNVSVVLACGVIAWHLGTWWGYLLAFVLVGARGQACYILQHEAMHNLLFTSPRTNERVGIALSAVLGTRFYMGRKIHWDHHRYVGHASDPNETFHNVENRSPGLPAIRFFLFHLFGGRLVMMVSNLGQTAIQAVFPKRHDAGRDRSTMPLAKTRIDLIALFGIQLVILGAISLLSSPMVYFALYVVPLVTLTAFFEAIRSFSEHVLPGTPTCEAEADRRFLMDAGPIERFFISQFDFHYHHVHHLYPNVVTFRVRALHRWLLANDPLYPSQFMTRPSYVGTALRYLSNRPLAGAGSGYPEYRTNTVRQAAE
jgi:fatty acid desaturase